MAAKEAITLLQGRVDLIKKDYPDIADYAEALLMAIEALNHLADHSKKVSSSCGQENDMVYRRAVIDIVRNECRCGEQAELIEEFEALPPAQPKILACGEGELNVPDTNVGDMIYRKAAIDAVMELFRRVPTNAIRAKKVIEELPSAQPEQRWIPCSERLPEKDTHFYLTTIANHGLNFTTTLPDDVDVVRWDYDRRKGRNSWHWCTERTVIAWTPLPEPYKGGQDEQTD